MREGFNQLPGAIAGGVRDAMYGTAQAVVKVDRDPVSPSAAASITRGRARGSWRRPPSRLRCCGAAACRPQRMPSTSHSATCTRPRRRPKARSTTPIWPACAARCGATTSYGVPVDTLPMAIPVNLRAESDPAGGNRFTGVNLAAPIGGNRSGEADQEHSRPDDPQARGARRRHGDVDRAGAERAARHRCSSRMAGSFTSDVQASNVPVYAGDTYIAGCENPPAVRSRSAARGGDDGCPGVAGGYVHGHRALRPGRGNRRRPVRALPAGGIRRGARAGGERASRAASLTAGCGQSSPDHHGNSAL